MDADTPVLLAALDIEKALVGCVLINPGVLDFVDIQDEDFYDNRNAMLWHTFRQMTANNVVIDFATVSEMLQRNKQLDQSMLSYLYTVINDTPSSMHAEDYARIVIDYSTRRNALRVATELGAAAWKTKEPIDQAFANALESLTSGHRSAHEPKHLGDVVSEVYDEVVENAKNPKPVWGIPTGFIDIDTLLGGLHKGEVFGLIGQPGASKSVLALQIAMQAALPENGQNASAIFSLEMPDKDIAYRAFSSFSKVRTREMKSGIIEADEWSKLATTLGELESMPVYLDDTPSLTLPQLRSRLAKLKATKGVVFFVLDYLMLMGGYEDMDETPRSALLSRGLKSIARQLDMAGLVISSVTKEGMEASGASMKHMRGAGSVIHDFDVVSELIADKMKPGIVSLVFTKVRGISGTRHTVQLFKSDALPRLETPTTAISFQEVF